MFGCSNIQIDLSWTILMTIMQEIPSLWSTRGYQKWLNQYEKQKIGQIFFGTAYWKWKNTTWVEYLGQKQNMELFLKNPYFPHVAEGTMYQNQLLHPDMNTILLDVVNT